MDRVKQRALGHYGRLLAGEGGSANAKRSSKKSKVTPSPERPGPSKKTKTDQKAVPPSAFVTKTSGAASSDALPFPIASRTPRPVEVVRFDDPRRKRYTGPVENRKTFMSSKVSDLYQEDNTDSDEEDGIFGSSGKRRKAKKNEDGEIDFDGACNDIRRLVEKSGSAKEIANRYGFSKPTKPVKMPYKMMMRVNKYHNRQEKEKAELMRLSGVGATNRSKAKVHKQKAKPSGRGRWKDTAQPLNASIGRFHNGTQHITPSEIQKVQRKGRRRR